MSGACVEYAPRPLDPAAEIEALRALSLDSTGASGSDVTTQEPTHPFDLAAGLDEAELVGVALALNPDLRARRLAIGEAQALLVAAGVWPNPVLGLSVRSGVGAVPGFATDLDFLFELLRTDERAARLAAATAAVESTRAEIAAEEARVASQARRSRVVVLAAQESLRLSEREVELRDEALQQARRANEVGENSALDVGVVELERAAARRDLRDAQRDVEQARIALNRTLGLPPDHSVPLRGSGQPFQIALMSAPDAAEIDRRIQTERLDVVARECEYRRTEEELRLAIASQVPHLALGPAIEQDGEGSTTIGVGSSLEIPLFDRNQAQIARASAARESARGEYVAALQRARSEAFEARAVLRRARTEIETQLEEVVPLIVRNEDAFDRALRSRELTMLDWVNARGRSAAARRAFLTALVRHAQAVIELETALGGRLLVEANHEPIHSLETR